MTEVLVTGSEGNIGAYLVPALRRLHPSWTIVRVCRTRSEDPDVVAGDLMDPAFSERLVARRRIKYVIHAAASPYTPQTLARPFALFDHDLVMFLHVLRACQGSVARVVFLSSATVYEGSPAVALGEDATDSAPPPRSPLALAKFAGERALAMWSSQRDSSYTIWRLFNVVSPREDFEDGGHVFVDLYRKLFVERQSQIRLRGDGQQERSFVWVQEVAEQMAAALCDDRADRQTFNLGGAEARTVRDLANTMLEIGKRAGHLPTDYMPEILGDEPSPSSSHGPNRPVSKARHRRLPDTRKAESVLGWRPQLGFAECFERFIADMQAHGH